MKTREEFVQYFKEHDKIRVIDAHQAKVHSVAWNCDGRFLASGSFDKTVSVLQLENGYKLVSVDRLYDRFWPFVAPCASNRFHCSFRAETILAAVIPIKWTKSVGTRRIPIYWRRLAATRRYEYGTFEAEKT